MTMGNNAADEKSGHAAGTANIAPVPSPCIDVCRMNRVAGWCEGCLRTIDEIAGWSSFDEQQKRAVWDAIDARHARLIAEKKVPT
ncbi:MAG: DUF1289 domain-containing protein [Paraburkholderia sp.]|uniref:DUF1289 domain-containing protein n=1 Tax=Paraburkholderia sp. TaxID=1926495 RepID=UPI0011F59972|nr:DUF1289 domain-containing protein [Paraburkholderia sp.]TAL96840.1 MAG: DUF1289 domain-containing protein [Paraburkholderia sp.]